MKDQVTHHSSFITHHAKPYQVVKTVLDVVLGVALLVLFSPAMLVIAVLIRLDSPGPAIYRQARVGANRNLFTMYKFRTMKAGTPALSTEEMQRKGHVPVTRVGHFLRRISLDELPQLLNIAKGQMSFIGPRPALPTQTDVLALRAQLGVDRIRPGLTGLAQVMGRDDLRVETKVGYDDEYCGKLNFWMDLRILARTIGAIASARGNK